MSLPLRATKTLLAGLAVLFVWAPGCSNQSEGDRCDYNRNGHQDCEPPLICVQAAELIGNDTDRCCPQPGQPISDDRCLPSSAGIGGSSGDAGKDAKTDASGGSAGASGSAGAAGSSGGTGGSAGSGGTGGSAGSGGDAGLPCSHSSDCPGTLVCGPKGVCQVQCINDKDCALGQTCNTSTNTCELAVQDAGGD